MPRITKVPRFTRTVISTAALLPLLIGAQSFSHATAASPAPSFYTPVTPTRICDTRPGNPSGLAGGAAQCNGHTLVANQAMPVQVTGLAGIPSSATAVALNVTALDASESGYLSVYPAASSPPDTSTLIFHPGAPSVNFTEVGLANGALDLYANAAVDVILDVEGYFSASGAGFTPITPTRICDTRPGNPSGLAGGAAQCNGSPIAPFSSRQVQVAGLAGVPSSATAIVANVTTAGDRGPGFLTVYTSGSPPMASDINWLFRNEWGFVRTGS